MTLTEAQLKSGIIVVPSGANGTSTNCRRISYAERYRASSAVQETPAEYLQKAARDEEERRRDLHRRRSRPARQ